MLTRSASQFRRSFHLLIPLGLLHLGMVQAAELPTLSGGKAITHAGQFVNTGTSFRGGTTLDGNSFQTVLQATPSSKINVQAHIAVDAADVGKTADLLFVIGAEYNAPFDGGADTTYVAITSMDGKTTAPLDLYNSPDVWMTQLAQNPFQSGMTLPSEIPLSGIELQLNSTPGMYYYFVGYRSQEGNVVYAANPLIVQVSSPPKGSDTTPDQPSGDTDSGDTDSGGTDTDTPVKPQPQFLSSYGFLPNPNGFSFENYSNDQQSASDLTAEDMIKLFGQDKVCRTPEGECILNAAAQQWMEEQIKRMNGGHCEGMAVMSMLLRQELEFKGKKSPADYQAGANTTYDLQKDSVRNGIAYYFVTQGLQPLQAKAAATSEKKPSEVLQTLLDSMGQGVAEPYTLGLYQPGYKGGHAVTPYAVEQKSGDEFWIYVYDNNFPNDTNRAVKINRASETWVYEGAATNPNEPTSDYRGDATTKTLDLTAQSWREGTFECSFCPVPETTRAATEKTLEFALIGVGKMLIQTPDGNRVGYDFETGQEVNTLAGATATYGKYGLGKDIPPTYTIPMPKDNAPITITISGKDLQTETSADVMMTGNGYVVGFESILLDPAETLVMQIHPDGRTVRFTASQDGETPAMFIAQDPANDTDPGYLFDVGGAQLDADKTMTFTLADNALQISDDDGNVDQYDIQITRIDDAGINRFKKDDVAINANARIDFSQWNGDGVVSLQEDAEGDGYENEEVNPLN